VSVKKGERRELIMARGNERIEFQLRYRLKRGQRQLTPDELRWREPHAQRWEYALQETDMLIFEIKTWLPSRAKREWTDSKRGSLEDQLGEIAAAILSAFPALEDLRRQREEEKRRSELAAQERYAREQECKLDEGRFERLLEHLRKWQEAELARSFIAALRARVPLDAEAVADVEIADWFAWAERKFEEQSLLSSDPRSVFESIAEVTSWTYRKG
jgi:hypothetical protein